MTPTEIATFVSGLLALANPLIRLGPFLEMTEGLTESERRRFLLSGLAVMILGYLGAVWIGSWIGSELLSLLGVTTPMLNAAGGMVIIALAFPMVLGGGKEEKKTSEDEIASVHDEKTWRSKAVVPFGIPLLVGGGQIAYLITATTQFPGTGAAVAMSIGCLLIIALMGISLRYAVPLSDKLGDTGTQVISRLFGFVLLAIGWSVFTKGLVALMPGLGG
jgi:multiple antibiotic resistance protein